MPRFADLELESRAVVAKLRNLVEQRVAVRRCGRALLPRPELFDFAAFDADVIANSEALLVQLNQVLVDMSVVCRKYTHNNAVAGDAAEDGTADYVYAINQEYTRKMQLMETLQPLGEFSSSIHNDDADLAFYTSFELAWRSS